jgi:hypothetical protein
MTTGLPSPPHKRARLGRALDSVVLATWPTVDPALIADSEDRQRFEKLKDAVELYAGGALVADVIILARVGERWFHRLVRRCQAIAPDGRPWGFRCLVMRSAGGAPVRTKPRDEQTSCASAGYGGYFRRLLRAHPAIESGTVAALKRQGKDRLMPNTLDFRGVHRIFLRECRRAGLTDDDYPFNTESQARAPLRKWLKTDFMTVHAVSWFAHEVSPDAAQSAAYGQGTGQDTRLEEPYAAWQIDEMTVDALARYQIVNETGDTDDVDLDRFMVIRVIALGSSANLSWGLVLARQVAAHDLVAVLWDAIHGHEKAEAVIPGLEYNPDGGFPATAIPALQYKVPLVIYVDNALAHLADALQRLVTALWGATIRIGRPGVPQERAEVESQIKLMTHQLLHQLPATTGSHPRAGVRKRAKRPVQHRLVASELAHTIDVYLANKNGLPAAAARYIAPLERLRRQQEAGVIKVNTLPIALRRAHLFYSPAKVTVRADLKRGRRPFVNFMGVRYTSEQLQRSFGLVGKVFSARCDPRDLRTVWLYERDSGHEWGELNAMGRWGKFPHDMRIRKLFLLLKRKAELGERADDAPLEQLYQYLRQRAPSDRRDATRLAYLMRYLEAWTDAPDAGVQEACHAWRAAEEAANDAQTLVFIDEIAQKVADDTRQRREEAAAQAEAVPRVLTLVPVARRRIRR